MKQLALQLPDGQEIPNLPIPTPKDFTQQEVFSNLGGFLSSILNVIFYLALFLAFFWLVWGAWAYLFAQGEKENLAKARARIQYAIIGLIVTLLAFVIAKFAGEVLTPTGGVPF